MGAGCENAGEGAQICDNWWGRRRHEVLTWETDRWARRGAGIGIPKSLERGNIVIDREVGLIVADALSHSQ